jgi:hypothetical protein
LDNLIEQLKKSTNGNIPLADKASLPEILWQKLPYPYRYIDNYQKFSETSHHPLSISTMISLERNALMNAII